MSRNAADLNAEPGSESDLAELVDTRRTMRIAIFTLVLGFGGFLLWAALAPLDEGVPTQGMVVIDTKRKAVQHQTGGIVKQVLVKEGQLVSAMEPLIHLEGAVAVANYETVRQHYLTLRATEGRLQAEQNAQPAITFHADLLNSMQNPYVKQTIATQEKLFHSRRNAIQAEVQAIAESAKAQEASIQGYEGMLGARKAQLASIEEDIKGMRDMVREGYAPRSKLLEFERMAAEAMSSISDNVGNIQRLGNAIAELKLRSIQRRQEYRKEVDTQLAEVRREVQADAEKYRAASEELSRTIIRSPAQGQVVGLAVQTVGGVVTPGQKLMDIVPANESLLLETKVPPHMIDRVSVGGMADVRFSGFAHTPQLVVEGKIISVSGDLLTEPNQPPYYLTRVAVTAAGLRKLENRVMQPGMPVEAVFKTGERTLLNYLLHPLLKRMAASMKEE